MGVNSTPRRRIDTKMLLASMGISFGLVLFIMGARVGLTGKDASNLPDAIEGISPGNNERVLRQSQIIVDFVEGYEATLFIDDVEMPTTRLDELVTSGTAPAPGAQIDLPPTAIYDPGNFTISFLPQDGAPIEEFAQGEHSATVRYWRTDGSSKVRAYSWTFTTD